MRYEWQCSECEVVVEIQRPIAECNTPPDREVACLCEQSQWKRVFSMPMVVGKASYLDGQKRPGWQDLKEAAKLEKEAANSRQDKKKEIAAEIRKLGVRTSKEII